MQVEQKKNQFSIQTHNIKHEACMEKCLRVFLYLFFFNYTCVLIFKNLIAATLWGILI